MCVFNRFGPEPTSFDASRTIGLISMNLFVSFRGVLAFTLSLLL